MIAPTGRHPTEIQDYQNAMNWRTAAFMHMMTSKLNDNFLDFLKVFMHICCSIYKCMFSMLSALIHVSRNKYTKDFVCFFVKGFPLKFIVEYINVWRLDLCQPLDLNAFYQGTCKVLNPSEFVTLSHPAIKPDVSFVSISLSPQCLTVRLFPAKCQYMVDVVIYHVIKPTNRYL